MVQCRHRKKKLTPFFSTFSTSSPLQDTTVVARDPETKQPVFFYHPALQSAFMFCGEALCLALHALLSAKATRAAAAAGRPPPRRKATRATVAAFAAPALLDATGTTLINVGLFYTAARTYQMLRGPLVVVAGLFTVTVLRRRLVREVPPPPFFLAAPKELLGLSLATREAERDR